MSADPFFKTCAKHLQVVCALWKTMLEREAELDAMDAALADPACSTDEQRKHLDRLAAIIRETFRLARRAARLQARMQKHLQSEAGRGLALEILRLDALERGAP